MHLSDLAASFQLDLNHVLLGCLILHQCNNARPEAKRSILCQVVCHNVKLIMNSMKLVIPLHFISCKNSFSDISRKCILPNVIRSNHISKYALPAYIIKLVFA